MATLKRDIRSAMRQRMAATDRAVIQELAVVASDTGKTQVKKRRKVVDDWRGKPIFAYRVTVRPTFVRVTVFPRGQFAQRWRWIDRGTKGPYIIRARRKPSLTFQGGYSAKTQPIAKFNVGTGGRTGRWVSKKQVTHPGIKARKFSETFEAEALPDLRKDINNALRRGLRRGHGG